MKQEISELSSAELENSTDSLVLIFSSKYTPSTIELHEPVQEDVGQIEKTVERLSSSLGLPHGGKVTKTCQRLKLKVSYDGDKNLLLKCPKGTTGGLPTYDELTNDEIVHYVDYDIQGKDADTIKNTIQNDIREWRKKLDRYVNSLNRDIRKMQASLENKARKYIEDHRETMEAKEEALADLGISTQPVDEGYVEPEKKKNLELPDLEGASKETQKIRDKTFIDILDIIDSVKLNIERSKDRVRELDEESLRDIFLLAINTHYGAATAESFNRGGKSDILLRHQGENLFVAECKFWRGESVFQDAVDQLLENLTVNDGHATLLIFSDRKKVTRVYDKAEDAINNHKNSEGEISQFKDHGVYRFQNKSGTEVKIAFEIVDLSVDS
jgi:hypothetical protein